MRIKMMLLAGAASVLATPALAAPAARAAVSQEFSVDMPAQPLDMALFAVSRTTGLQLIFTDRGITTLRAPRLAGHYTAPQLLDALLAGTGYTYRFTGSHSVRIVASGAHTRTGDVALTPIGYGARPAAATTESAEQVDPAPPSVAALQPAEVPQDIIVVGSQIEGTKVTAALPVTVVTRDEIAATGAVSGDELFRSIPQLGDVSFNASYLPNSSNAARGDVGSVNLRNLGVGNTLVLLNGRRVVNHPTSRADDNLVPVLTYNTNAIPVAGVERLEVLRDGAAAIYGSDAVAGVVNTVLEKDYRGLSLGAQYGLAENTGMHEFSATMLAGKRLGDRGNVTIFADYTHRSMLRAADQDFTASDDVRPLFAGTSFDGSTSLDGRSTTTPWGYFQATGVSGAVKLNGKSLTSSSGYFHIQPQTNPGCLANLAGGICIDDGSISTSTVDRNLRYDRTAASNRSIMPATDRGNIFMTGHYEVAPEVELFGEAGLYLARTRSVQTAPYTLSATPITIPASNYYNPFGPVTFANGAANPNRLAGLTNVPATGLPVILRTYDFSDTGPTEVDVWNSQYRLLGGLRWRLAGFQFESALLYSAARVHDRSDGISATLLQRQLALSTPDAYNPFNGANLENNSLADNVKSSQAAIDAVRIRTDRISTSSLALWDIKASRPDLLHLPGGDLGIAFGGEVRRETQDDDRDPRVDGTTTFTDMVTGVTYASDLVGTSASPDTHGVRTVASAYAELAVPVVSPGMGVPLVHNLEFQLAGRFEHYSDIGSVAKPKIAGAWDVIDGLRLRGSYSEGFKAPNLEQVNATLVTRSNTRTDWVRCEADLRAGRISSFANCSNSQSVTAQRAGNPGLKPEESRTFSAGVVIEPKFIPRRFGRLTLTVDYWNVKQNGIVGLFGEGNALTLDYLLRLKGSSNPNVVRAAPTSDDIAQFAGTGIDPVGQVLYVSDVYRNLLPQTASGVDFGVQWRLRGTSLGNFSLSLNAAYLRTFYLSPSPDIQALLDARAAGDINAGTSITGGGDLVRQNGKPRWKASGTLTWSKGPYQLGVYSQYTGSIEDTGLIDSVGNPWLVKDSMTFNLYGQVTVGSKQSRQFRLRLGARNLFDVTPPLSSSGYEAALYSPYRRYLYVNVRTSF